MPHDEGISNVLIPDVGFDLFPESPKTCRYKKIFEHFVRKDNAESSENIWSYMKIKPMQIHFKTVISGNSKNMALVV